MKETSRKDEIMVKALELFASFGYEPIGVQEIVKAAGVSKPTLYYYYGSKRGLLDAILKYHFDILFDDTCEAAVYREDLMMTLRSLVKAYVKFAQSYGSFYRMQMTLLFAPPHSEAFAAISPFRQRQHQLLEEVFITATNRHGNMKGRHHQYTVSFLGTLNAYIGQALMEDGTIDDVLVNQLVHQFMYGILS